MHIITHKRIREAMEQYPKVASALEGWYRVIKKSKYKNMPELKKTFNSVDYVDGKFVFDIGGNKLRLIAVIHFNREKVYIRHILTHKEYDKGKWKK